MAFRDNLELINHPGRTIQNNLYNNISHHAYPSSVTDTWDHSQGLGATMNNSHDNGMYSLGFRVSGLIVDEYVAAYYGGNHVSGGMIDGSPIDPRG